MFLRRVVTALGLATGLAASQSAPIPPSQDPWYKAPAGYEKASPGTVLRIRAAPGNLTAIYGNSSSTWNLLYRTTDSNYRPSWAVTTVFAPKKGRGREALVSYQIPYNSPYINSSPSYTLYGADYSGAIVGADIQTMLGRGWFVSVPDHEGPLAAFGCAVSEGHATLDSVRAVRSLREAWAPSRNASVAMWGYSGGSLASEFAAELQVQYAPELRFAGMAIGGVVTNGSSTFQLASGTYFAGLAPAAIVGLTRQHPDANRTLLASLKRSGPYNASTFLSVAQLTIDQIFTKFQNQDIAQYLTDGFGILQTPAFRRVIDNDILMGYHGTPQMPMFVYKAVGDEICPIGETDALISRYCDVGANIAYQRNSIGGHVAEETNGDASALSWLQSVLAGTYNHTGCSISNVTINVTGSSL